MLRGTRSGFALAALAAPLLVTGVARAQLSGPTANATQQVNPDRIVNGQNLGQSERPSNLNPTAVSYSDCIRDMTLRFYINLSGFTGQNLQVWATRSNTCTDPTARGIGSSAATCWQVNGGVTAFQSITNSSQTFDVRVQDLVGPQNAPPYPPNLVHEGASACNVQSSYAAVSMVLWFIPLDSGGNYTSGAYQYPIQVDLQGPPPPSGLGLSVGDTLFQVSWSPNVDTDTIGYDIYIDPIPGAAVSDATTAVVDANDASDAPLSILVCPDTGTSSSSDGSSSVDDGSTDAVASDASDESDAPGASASASDAQSSNAGCYYMAVPPPLPTALDAGSCKSSILAQGYVAEGGSTTIAPVYDDAGNLIDDGGTASGSGGISGVPAANVIAANGTTTMTISGKSVGAYTISGLTNGPPGYTIAISAVDAVGNIGPPSAEMCDFPAPVNDFYKTYRLGGGRAGGGFCTLEAVGAPVDLTILALPAAATIVGLARRRRRRRP